MNPRTPAGFYVASVCAAAFGAMMAVLALFTDHLGTPLETAWARAVAALLAVFSAVAAEALWSARPWAYRASLTLALVYAALVTLLSVALQGPVDGAATAFWALFASAWVVVPAVVYVRHRSARPFTRPPPRPAPPRPVARPVPPGGRRQPWW